MFIGSDVVKLGEFDVTALAEKVARISDETWSEKRGRQQEFPVHADTQTIWLLYDDDFRHFNPTRRPAMDEFETDIAPLLGLIESNYQETLKDRIIPEKFKPAYFIRIIMARLRAGGKIGVHADGGYSLKRCHRVHLPIITSEKCLLTCGDTTLHMRPGEIWEINNRQWHSVDNDGDEPRVHMILDYVQPGELVNDPKGPVAA